ncbi:MAG: Gfo/Idh/MocA family oxidoreductase [Bryobacterales bacterium]|nr:Gfo/Idh/MocA family oxidoreductase [Bryobacterales bacterium]
MQSRRNFIGHVASGLAGTLASSNVLGANDRIRLGVIGAGARGQQLIREAGACPNTEIAALADIFTVRLDEARSAAPGARTFQDPRQLLEDKSIDAVLIATPQHLHGAHFLDAIDAGKHVFQEKTMAFTVDEAKRMRAAHRKGKRVVQVGHQICSSGLLTDATAWLAAGDVGRVTAIHAHMYRNTPHGKPQWSRPVHPEMTPDNVQWEAFLGDAPELEFDANRYANWRYFWDYSGGNVYENLCHQLAFWYKAMDLTIPSRVTMTGGVYLWKDGREVPDTMSVSMEHAEELLFTWDSGFGNNHLGSTEEVLGTDGTLVKGQQIRYVPQKVNRPDGVEILGRTRTEPRAHMQNFLDCIRSGKEPNCPFDLGYRVSIACRMAVESYRQSRTVGWDPAREEIV